MSQSLQKNYNQTQKVINLSLIFVKLNYFFLSNETSFIFDFDEIH